MVPPVLDYFELKRYLAGELDEIIELAYPGQAPFVWFERLGPMEVEAHIPRDEESDRGYGIVSALTSPVCAAIVVATDNEYIVRVTSRGQFRIVANIASNYRGWPGTSKIVRFRKRA